MKFQNKIQKFMYGRYGFDELYGFLLKIYIILLVIDLFLNRTWLAVTEIVVAFVMIYRVLSKKIYIRSRENVAYLNIKKRIKNEIRNVKNASIDKNNVYKKCHKCKTVLKLPLPDKRGIKYVVCPKCKNRNRFLILKKQKVEIIKKKSKRSRI